MLYALKYGDGCTAAAAEIENEAQDPDLGSGEKPPLPAVTACRDSSSSEEKTRVSPSEQACLDLSQSM